MTAARTSTLVATAPGRGVLPSSSRTGAAVDPASAPVRVYRRVSQDRDNDLMAVDRQLAIALLYKERHGLTGPVEVYTDDDTSAYTGKRRRDYDRLVADIEREGFCHVVVRRADRMHRNVQELLNYIALAQSAGRGSLAMVTHSVDGGELDLSSASGVMHAISLANFAQFESAVKAERLKDKHAELAMDGKFSGGPRRFGYSGRSFLDTGIPVAGMDVIVPAEAEIVREVAERILNGEANFNIARDLNARGIVGARGGRWQSANVGAMFRGGAWLAGVRTRGGRKGDIVRDAAGHPVKASWEPILTFERWQAVYDKLTDPDRYFSHSTARKHLLVGIARCGTCDAAGRVSTMMTHGKHYLCREERHVSIPKSFLDSYVAELVAAWVVDTDTDTTSPVLGGRLRELDARTEELTAARKLAVRNHALGRYDDDDLDEALAAIRAEQAAVTRERTKIKTPPAALAELAKHAGSGVGAVRAAFESLPLDTRRAVVETLGYPVVAPARKRGERPSPARVRAVWTYATEAD